MRTRCTPSPAGAQHTAPRREPCAGATRGRFDIGGASQLRPKRPRQRPASRWSCMSPYRDESILRPVKHFWVLRPSGVLSPRRHLGTWQPVRSSALFPRGTNKFSTAGVVVGAAAGELCRRILPRHGIVYEAVPVVMNEKLGFLGISAAVYYRVWFDTESNSQTLFNGSNTWESKPHKGLRG